MMPSGPDEPGKPHLDLWRQEASHLHDRLLEKDREVYALRNELREKDGKHSRTIDELNAANEKLFRLEERYNHIVADRTREENKVTKKRVNATLQVLLLDILFLLASIAASFGINLITSGSSIQAGWVLIGLAIVTYLVSAIIGVLRTLGSEQ
jgi:ABC-type multidrug transport system fused ATPase/permease subunit